MSGQELIESLLNYAVARLHADPRDRVYLRNRLLAAFGLNGTDVPAILGEVPYNPDPLFDELTAYGERSGENGDLFATEIMGLLTPPPSAVERRFCEIERLDGITAACDDFYALCIASNYIRMSRVARNKKWTTQDEIPLEITINLSKPEKSNREVAKALTVEESKYPECLLCAQNEGYRGTDTHPARGNLRTLSLKLDGQDWFMQYSPYLYFNEHCIVIKKDHVPMSVDAYTPRALLDFVERFSTYFLGSNAALPLVGGSILTHEHFQGGRHTMPMQRAGVKKWFQVQDAKGVGVGEVDWYNNVLRVSGRDKTKVAEVAGRIITEWRGFDAPEVGVLSRTGDTEHNAVAPIARRIGTDYAVDCVLRNNRTDEQYPEGIFHAHPERHAIKKEAIGLIEAMGLFILPGRLNEELRRVQSALQNPQELAAMADSEHPLHRHYPMAKALARRVAGESPMKTATAVMTAVNDTCKNILIDTAVFKDDPEGNRAMIEFMKRCGIKGTE